MWKNYLKTTYRNLIRNKVYSIINILGLTIGIACFSVIMLYVENELSFDRFHSKESYRFLLTEQTGDGDERTYGTIGVNTLKTIADEVAGIEDVILLREFAAGPLLVKYKDVEFKTRRMVFAESDFFDYFDFNLLQGNPKTALDDPNNVILTKSTAERIFGDTNPVGEFIRYSGGMNFTLQVTGVVEDPENSHLDFDFIMNFDLKDESGYIIMREGFANSIYGYYKFEEGVVAADVAERTKAYFLDVYKDSPDDIELLARESYEFQSIYDIYFGSLSVTGDTGLRKGNMQSITILGGIGLFILLIACMNYINAATAKAINRGKEIGVRKVFGAFKSQLISQFMGEAFFITLIAVVLSVLLTDITLPVFESLMETELRYSLLSNPTYIVGLAIVLVSVTLMSGTYPAIVLSGFKPSESLKNQSGNGMLRGNGLRKLLVGLQLFFTMILISSMLLIVKQSEFINNMDLGFSKEDILIVPNNSQRVADQLTTYKNELLKSPYIYKATTGMDVLGFGSTNNSGRVILEGEDPEQAPVASFFTVGMDFIDIQGIKIKDGRTFDVNLGTDSTAIVVNEAFVKAYGVENVPGKKVRLWSAEGELRPIIGVVEDFNFQSLHANVSPAIFTISKDRNWFWTLKIDPENKQAALNHAKSTWESIEASYPFGYMFLEDNLQNFYGEEERLQNAIQGFALICVFISCLGLYGMTAFTLERKMKEIGIRKVLGAHLKHLVWMINKKFVSILMVAAVVAVPIVYYAIDVWLTGFAYHMTIGFMSFVWAGIIVLSIVLLTVSWQAIKAAIANPAATLRSE